MYYSLLGRGFSLQIDMSKIPVTVVTGFLGAGKTSLLNHLIETHPDKKFAIIENEFGEENIDSELVANVESDDIFELSNGCICCSLNQDLYDLLQKLIQSDHQFNHLLIETTGIADPGSILASFVSDPFIKKEFDLDSVICLIDAKNAISDLEKEEVLHKQIAIADTVLINKVDLIQEQELEEIKTIVRAKNKWAKQFTCSNAKLKGETLLDVYSYDPMKIYQFIFQIEGKQKDHSLQHEIDNMLFTSEKAMDQMKLGMWLDAFLQFNQDSIYRIKGIVNIAGFDNRVVLQSVHTQIQATVGKAWDKDEKRESKIVIIGKSLNKDVITDNLMELCM